MKKRCPRCNHPTDGTFPACFACARPLPLTKPKPAKAKRNKPRKARRKAYGPHHRDNDPIAS